MNAALQTQFFLDERAALIELMKAIAKYGRPSSLPPDVRVAWDECERVLGNDAAREVATVCSKAMFEKGVRQIAKIKRQKKASDTSKPNGAM